MIQKNRNVFTKSILVGLVYFFLGINAFAQFESGSNGSDGDLIIRANASQITWFTLPPSGVLHYKRIEIPAGKILQLIGNNLTNLPAILLASEEVVISGSINLSGFGPGTPFMSPGSFRGGIRWKEGDTEGSAGFGPGGVIYGETASFNGPNLTYSNEKLQPLMGGSGQGSMGNRGGDGGGAILIASSKSIVINGAITANGGGGTGGAIRLVANSISGTGELYATPNGRIRLEAPNGTEDIKLTSFPNASIGRPGPIFMENQPTLKIIEINSETPEHDQTRPVYDVSSPDLHVYPDENDYITVTIAATFVPLETIVQLKLFAEGTATWTTFDSTPLAGGYELSSAQVLIPVTEEKTYIMELQALRPSY